MKLVNHLAHVRPLSFWVQHYRERMHEEPRSARFWRQRLRVVIQEYREQQNNERAAA